MERIGKIYFKISQAVKSRPRDHRTLQQHDPTDAGKTDFDFPEDSRRLDNEQEIIRTGPG